MTTVKYDGYELEYFDHATNFRKYQIKLVNGYLKNNDKILYK